MKWKYYKLQRTIDVGRNTITYPVVFRVNDIDNCDIYNSSDRKWWNVMYTDFFDLNIDDAEPLDNDDLFLEMI